MISSKYLVLNQILRAGEGYISGQDIAEELAISRSAVNKAVTALRNEGYTVEALNHEGYHMDERPDLINYGELLYYMNSKRVENIAVYGEVVSTNVTLHELAEKGVTNGYTVIAASQTGGRGREGSGFDSPDNKSIYMSYLIRPDMSKEISYKEITPAAADIVAESLRDLLSGEIALGVNYPGDVCLDGKKICGILTEMLMEAESGFIRYIMLGIGVRPIKNIRRSELVSKIIDKLDTKIIGK